MELVLRGRQRQSSVTLLNLSISNAFQALKTILANYLITQLKLNPSKAAFLDLGSVLTEGRADSAADTKISESELWLGVTACDTQMWQAGQTSIQQARGNANQ